MSGEVYTPHYVSASEVQHELERADAMVRPHSWFQLARTSILALVYIGQQLEDVNREYAGRTAP